MSKCSHTGTKNVGSSKSSSFYEQKVFPQTAEKALRLNRGPYEAILRLFNIYRRSTKETNQLQRLVNSAVGADL